MRFLPILVISLLGLGCKGKSVPPAPPVVATGAFQASASTDAPVPASAAAEPPPPQRPVQPLISLVANGAGDTALMPGRPLLVELRVMHPRLYERDLVPLVIASASSSWSGAVHIEVRNAKGELVSWPLHPIAAQEPGALTLDASHEGVLLWRLSPEEVAAIPAGPYELVAIVDTNSTTTAGAWKGLARAVPITVRVTAKSQRPSVAERVETAMLLAADAERAGDLTRAIALLEAITEHQAASAAAFEMKGELLAELGDLDAALAAYNEALTLTRSTKPPPREPPREWLRRRERVLERIRQK